MHHFYRERKREFSLHVREEEEREALQSRYGDEGRGSWLPINRPTSKQRNR